MKTLKRAVLASAMAILAIMIGAAAPNISRAAEAQQETANAASSATPTPASPNVLAGEASAKQLLLLMDTDKSGKVSKQEFMAYMEAEFDRLDVNKDGELDVKELTKPKPRSVAGGHK